MSKKLGKGFGGKYETMDGVNDPSRIETLHISSRLRSESPTDGSPHNPNSNGVLKKETVGQA